jgi:hypothetical protein
MRRRVRGQDLGPRQGVEVREIRRTVDHHDRDHSADEGARHVAAGILDLSRGHRHVVPAVVGPQRREHRQPERRDTAGVAAFGERQMRPVGGRRQNGDPENDEPDPADLEDRQRRLDPPPNDHGQAIDDGKEHNRSDRHHLREAELPLHRPAQKGVGGVRPRAAHRDDG